VLSGHRQEAVDESQVVAMLDGLSVNDDEDHSSVDSDSDTSEDATTDRLTRSHSNTLPPLSGSSDSVLKDEKPSVQEAPSLDSGPSSKAVIRSGSGQFRRGLFKSCIVDMSASVPSAKSTGQELHSGCDNNSVGTTCNSRDLPKKVTEEQTTLERVKSCMYEWKTTELVAYLHASPTETIDTGDDGLDSGNDGISDTIEVNKDNIENNTDRREETVKIYERKVGEFYGTKRRVQFADSCKQVFSILAVFLLFF